MLHHFQFAIVSGTSNCTHTGSLFTTLPIFDNDENLRRFTEISHMLVIVPNRGGGAIYAAVLNGREIMHQTRPATYNEQLRGFVMTIEKRTLDRLLADEGAPPVDYSILRSATAVGVAVGRLGMSAMNTNRLVLEVNDAVSALVRMHQVAL